MISVGAAVLGAALAVFLSFKDAVHRRVASGGRVAWPLRLYLTKGPVSVFAWTATVMVVSFVAIILLFGILGL